jgi:hypothetical protein
LKVCVSCLQMPDRMSLGFGEVEPSFLRALFREHYAIEDVGILSYSLDTDGGLDLRNDDRCSPTMIYLLHGSSQEVSSYVQLYDLKTRIQRKFC